jgi:hypothetical protein
MASIISAGTTSGTALNLSGDTSGNLAFTTQAGANTITVPNVTGTLLTNKSAGTVLQVVYSALNTKASSASTTYANTGLTASITPSLSTNKIAVFVVMNVAQNNANDGLGLQLMRNGSSVFAPSPADGTGPYLFYTTSPSATYLPVSMNYLDSPATTSSVTYAVQYRSYAGGTVFINGTGTTSGTSTIILMEIAA